MDETRGVRTSRMTCPMRCLCGRYCSRRLRCAAGTGKVVRSCVGSGGASARAPHRCAQPA